MLAPSQGGPPAGVDDAVAVGGRVTAGTPVLTVVDTGQLGLLAEVDETDVLLVKAGVTATVELDAVTGASYDATVRSVDVLPTSSAQGGVTYRVRLALGAGKLAEDEPAPTPRPGMNAIVHLRVREAADAVTVPASAVFSADGRDAVWVVRDGKAGRAPVTVGVQGSDLVQILNGVQTRRPDRGARHRPGPRRPGACGDRRPPPAASRRWTCPGRTTSTGCPWRRCAGCR